MKIFLTWLPVIAKLVITGQNLKNGQQSFFRWEKLFRTFLAVENVSWEISSQMIAHSAKIVITGQNWKIGHQYFFSWENLPRTFLWVKNVSWENISHMIAYNAKIDINGQILKNWQTVFLIILNIMKDCHQWWEKGVFGMTGRPRALLNIQSMQLQNRDVQL